MIVDLPNTSTVAISKKLVQLRQDTGAMALGRVLTLVIVVDEQDAEEAIEAANAASRQHPCRIIAVVLGNKRGVSRLDGQIRVGGDAGASEVVVLRLYGALTEHGRSVVTPLLLPDSPVVAWWPQEAPPNVSADPIGSMAQRRITDAAATKNPRKALQARAKTYADGDTDLAWTRITLWRGLLAAALDQPPYEPVLEATVTGGSDSPSTDLLAAWLAQTLRCKVTRARSRAGTGMVSVRLERRSGAVDLVRPDGTTATLTQPRQPVRRITLARRATAECLADELRRLDPDDVYEETIRKGLPRVGAKTVTAGEAVREGDAPSTQEAAAEVRRLRRQNHHASSSAMVRAGSVAEKPADDTAVKHAAASKLAKVTTGADGAADRDGDRDRAPDGAKAAAGSGKPAAKKSR
ncbi:glucose-6-phosphate dehydrogenase assembly protein OpcA [Pedococcus sp. 5OH_020]|uniref:glucose-6-phosphate dehydrogenase assembly protein OpcA n=1 Tax=Pedococcus sp. 5OH_020 TaxID=2989814 RepID=UPI0022E99E0B|nr:glucose-6-phosphate dehydrogenase assembly protein OpcA [Pedococcus sp. 5OH_020]